MRRMDLALFAMKQQCPLTAHVVSLPSQHILGCKELELEGMTCVWVAIISRQLPSFPVTHSWTGGEYPMRERERDGMHHRFLVVSVNPKHPILKKINLHFAIYAAMEFCFLHSFSIFERTTRD